MGAKLYRFEVEVFLEGFDGPSEIAGQVLLPDYARRHEVEHALAAVGVYAPRGNDRLEWLDGNLPAAIIHDVHGGAVRLWPCP